MSSGVVPAEFEEKQFETSINHELANVESIVYAPGQVLENTLGIDAALVCSKSEFWKLFQNAPDSLYPAERTPIGIQMRNEYWACLDQAIERFPPVQFNLFLQHKRPEYATTPGCAEWMSWGAPYYRFALVDHQQKALEALAGVASGEALVAYACPAFHTLADLWQHSGDRTLIDATNFARANALAGHAKYSFQMAGAAGIGHSEPEDIESFDFRGEVARLRQIAPRRSNRETLFTLDEFVHMALKKTELQPRHGQIMELLSGEVTPLGRAILSIGTFAFLAGARWSLVLDPDEDKKTSIHI